VHPKWGTPYPAILVHATISGGLVLLNAVGSGVQEMFQRLLSLSVVLQLIPFLYMFGALLKLAGDGKGRYGRVTLLAAGATGLLTTSLGIVLVFFPARQITSLWIYEAWMFGGTAAFIGLAAFVFSRGRAASSPTAARNASVIGAAEPRADRGKAPKAPRRDPSLADLSPGLSRPGIPLARGTEAGALPARAAQARDDAPGSAARSST
jgi:hypothetical protein